jgi:hypothetical protein
MCTDEAPSLSQSCWAALPMAARTALEFSRAAVSTRGPEAGVNGMETCSLG